MVEPAVALAPAEYESIRALAYRKFGLELGPGKQELVRSRLAKHVRQLETGTYSEYLRRVESDPSGELLVAMIDALTTNHTHFFREKQHFEYLGAEVLPRLDAAGEHWFWSAASSTGEEPYSLAMWLAEHAGGRRFRILATDISTNVLRHAQQGVYAIDRLEGIPEAWRTRYLLRGQGAQSGFFKLRPEIRRMVEFRRLNLVEPFDLGRTFPAVFCRNVMIYFDVPTQERLLASIHRHLEPGGYVYVGHAESLSRVRQPFDYVRPAVYRKAETKADRA